MADVLLSIGRGPSGFNKLVVLKTMRRELVADDDMRRMFLEEARLSARLNHPNVVQVYEVMDSVLPCIVMEYLEGQSMSTILHAAGERFTLPLQLKVISDALAGLHYSHELKNYDGTDLCIVHRDVSPQNVFVTYNGVVKVVDFGIAKASDSGTHTQAGIVKGKITYMPREQLLGKGVDRRTDVYAIGCMLWSAAAGAKLWQGMADGDVMLALIDGNIPTPSERRPVDPALEAIIMKALAPDPEGRYRSALELKQAVDGYLARNYPATTVAELGEIVATLFEKQREARSKHIHMALTAPLSEPPPPISDAPQTTSHDTHLTARVIEDERRKTIILTAAIAAGTLLLVFSGMLVLLRWHGNSATVTTLSAPSKVATVQPSAQAQIRLSASPANALLTLDGALVSGNPAVLTVLVDGREHDIRATAPGYAPDGRRVRFERDLSLEIALSAQVSAATEQASAPISSVTSTSPRPERADSVRKKSSTVRVPNPTQSGTCNPPYYFENGLKHYKLGCL